MGAPAIQSSLTCVRSCMARAARAFFTALLHLAGHHVAHGLRHREPGRQLRVGPGRRLHVPQQIQVLASASDVSGQQQVNGQAQQPVRGIGQHRGRHRAQVQRRRQCRVAQEVGHDPVLQQGQTAVGLPGRRGSGGPHAGCRSSTRTTRRPAAGVPVHGSGPWPAVRRAAAGAPDGGSGSSSGPHRAAPGTGWPHRYCAAAPPRPGRPVTAAHASAVSSLRMDVSSMNRATSGGC